MTPHYTKIVVTSVALVISLATIMPSAISASDRGLPVECEAALTSAHDFVSRNRETLSFEEALTHLQETAGEQCGFDITGSRPNTVDATALDAFISQWIHDEPDAPQGGAQGEVNYLLATSQNLVPCMVPGAGAGTISGQVLGVELGSWGAAGQWKPVVQGNAPVIEVSGSAGIVSGVQAGLLGQIIIAVVPITAIGGTSEYCVELEENVTVEEGCIWYIIGYYCWRETTVQTKLVPCEASARQEVLLGLAALNHCYGTGAAECASEGA